MSRKLLIVGSNTLHVYNYIKLIRDYFDDVVLLTNEINSEWDVDSQKVNFTLGFHSIRTIGKIRQRYFKFKPSVVHIHQANSYAFLTILALKKYDVPIVLTAWGSDILINPHKSFLLKKILQYILNNVQVITADSNHVLHSAQKLVNKKLSLHNINFGIGMEECIKVEKENIIYSN
ncbi:MAG: glycosyltransferase, partial [Bacteroidales bacterium]|nr:glycosyltransferase [Bacteroidales bacterium]